VSNLGLPFKPRKFYNAVLDAPFALGMYTATLCPALGGRLWHLEGGATDFHLVDRWINLFASESESPFAALA
jgi:hypothetical protein